MQPIRVVSVALALLVSASLTTTARTAGQASTAESLQWINYNDPRLQWINVAAWEPRGDGMQPVRVPKEWRDKWPQDDGEASVIGCRCDGALSHGF